ncbi:MAG: hypothetical protein ABR570_16480, partial [Burkholderiales bacterium]
NVPEAAGIFCLWDNQHLVYVGRTAPRSDLRAELRYALTVAMAADLSATHFTYEETNTPKTRAAEELRDYFARWGALPRYNESVRRPDEGGVLRPGGAA